MSALSESNKAICTDKKFTENVTDARFSNHVFTRLVAKDKTFTKVDFRYSFFETSYLRDCHFDSCNFTGCRFVNSNLSGSKFSGCTFDYAYFEKTYIEPTILDTECPGFENLKLRFARTLRTNYQQLGDAASANKAMNVELSAASTHNRKAAWSTESYYRKHYAGWSRVRSILQWMGFNALDFIWGNGERPFRLFRFLILTLFAMAVVDTIYFGGEADSIRSYLSSGLKSFAVFFGAATPDDYPKWYIAAITCVRLVFVGFFLSIIIKRFNRR